ncbi:MAG: trypsin-like serine protease [Ferrovum sp.]|nr:trypsin-like serine protease [Ferrovum sp.]
MQKLWLIFAQTVTLCLGILFTISVFRHDHLGQLSSNQPAPPPQTAQMPPPEGREPIGSYRDAAHRAMPTVVNIFTRKASHRATGMPEDPALRQFFGDNSSGDNTPQQLSLGSGVIVRPDGYILTNDHVVDGAQEIQVALSDGRSVKATVSGTDPETDLAVLKVDLDHLPAITFGASDQVQVGDVVLAIGNPFGVGETVTSGIVSALGRSRLGINTFENFIQTDAAINPGNSGGALVNSSGELVGINSAIYSKSGGSQGIGFSIPVSLAHEVMDDIIRNGGVIRGWIGVEVQDITPELASSFQLDKAAGALISAVLRGGPAEQAGVHPGDILVAVNDMPIGDSRDMLNQVAALKPGQNGKLKVMRHQQTLVLSVIVGRRPKGTIRNLDDSGQ